MKTYFQRPVKILQFLARAEIQKYATFFKNILKWYNITSKIFSIFKMLHLQAKSCIWHGIFLLLVIPIIIPCWKCSTKVDLQQKAVIQYIFCPLVCNFTKNGLLCNYFSSILKWYFHLPKKYCCCLSKSPLKIMKNAFYFTLKPLFLLKMFKFSP